MTNRVGDFGLLLAVLLLTAVFGNTRFALLYQVIPAVPPGLTALIAFLLFWAAAAKSAQFPLYFWLPDAMEGPTPVSSLIHAATMVTAGVYMVARSNPIFDRAPSALMGVAIVGVITALFAAIVGMAQNDIKKVLAYSTISQLGYMFLACGVAAYSAAIFHLMTHAFFKGLLFLAAGAVIHALGGEQDMRRMGGLRREIPWTFWTMTAGTLAIAGIPFFSGFFSKDQILWKAWSSPQGSWAYWLIAVFTAFLTSFYMFRVWFMTFFGEYRGANGQGREHTGYRQKVDAEKQSGLSPHDAHIHESPKVMLAPMLILTILSVIGGYAGVPNALWGKNRFDKFLSPVFKVSAEAMPAGTAPGEPQGEAAAERAHEGNIELALTGVSVGVAFLGLFFAWLLYCRRRELPDRIAVRLGWFYKTVCDNFYVDEIYQAIIVGPIVNGSTHVLWRGVDISGIDATADDSAETAREISDRLRHMQSGNLRSYAAWISLGAALAMAYMIWMGVR